MNWIYVAFFLSLFFALCAGFKIRFVLSPHKNGIVQSKSKNYNTLFVLLFFAILFFVVGCRKSFIDTLDYKNMYRQIGTSIENAFNNTVPRVEKGYLFITALLNKISTDPQLLLFVFGAVTIFCFGRIIVKASEDITFSLILFSCNIWIGCMNGLRQIAVASILALFGYRLISDNKSPKKALLFIAITILLSTIHTSALFCIPFYFIAKGKFMNKWVWATVFGTILLLAFSPLYDYLFNSLFSSMSYSNMINTESKMGISRLFIAGAPVVLFIVNQFLGNNSESSKTDLWMMNLGLIGFLFSVLSLKMVYFARMRMYFSIFTTISLPHAVNKMFAGRIRMIIAFIVCILYIAVFLYQLKTYGSEVTDFCLFFE